MVKIPSVSRGLLLEYLEQVEKEGNSTIVRKTAKWLLKLDDSTGAQVSRELSVGHGPTLRSVAKLQLQEENQQKLHFVCHMYHKV